MAIDPEEPMPFSVETDVFATETEAIALLEARGCAVIAADVQEADVQRRSSAAGHRRTSRDR